MSTSNKMKPAVDIGEEGSLHDVGLCIEISDVNMQGDYIPSPPPSPTRSVCKELLQELDDIQEELDASFENLKESTKKAFSPRTLPWQLQDNSCFEMPQSLKNILYSEQPLSRLHPCEFDSLHEEWNERKNEIIPRGYVKALDMASNSQDKEPEIPAGLSKALVNESSIMKTILRMRQKSLDKSSDDVTSKKIPSHPKVDESPKIDSLTVKENQPSLNTNHVHSNMSPANTPSRSPTNTPSRPSKSSRRQGLPKANSSQKSPSSMRSSLRVLMKKKKTARDKLYQAILQGKADDNLKQSWKNLRRGGMGPKEKTPSPKSRTTSPTTLWASDQLSRSQPAKTAFSSQTASTVPLITPGDQLSHPQPAMPLPIVSSSQSTEVDDSYSPEKSSKSKDISPTLGRTNDSDKLAPATNDSISPTSIQHQKGNATCTTNAPTAVNIVLVKSQLSQTQLLSSEELLRQQIQQALTSKTSPTQKSLTSQSATGVLNQPFIPSQSARGVSNQPFRPSQSAMGVLNQPFRPSQSATGVSIQPFKPSQSATGVLNQPFRPSQSATVVLNQAPTASQSAAVVLNQLALASQSTTLSLNQGPTSNQSAVVKLNQNRTASQLMTQSCSSKSVYQHALSSMQAQTRQNAQQEVPVAQPQTNIPLPAYKVVASIPEVHNINKQKEKHAKFKQAKPFQASEGTTLSNINGTLFMVTKLESGHVLLSKAMAPNTSTGSKTTAPNMNTGSKITAPIKNTGSKTTAPNLSTGSKTTAPNLTIHVGSTATVPSMDVGSRVLKSTATTIMESKAIAPSTSTVSRVIAPFTSIRSKATAPNLKMGLKTTAPKIRLRIRSEASAPNTSAVSRVIAPFTSIRSKATTPNLNMGLKTTAPKIRLKSIGSKASVPNASTVSRVVAPYTSIRSTATAPNLNMGSKTTAPNIRLAIGSKASVPNASAVPKAIAPYRSIRSKAAAPNAYLGTKAAAFNSSIGTNATAPKSSTGSKTIAPRIDKINAAVARKRKATKETLQDFTEKNSIVTCNPATKKRRLAEDNANSPRQLRNINLSSIVSDTNMVKQQGNLSIDQERQLGCCGVEAKKGNMFACNRSTRNRALFTDLVHRCKMQPTSLLSFSTKPNKKDRLIAPKPAPSAQTACTEEVQNQAAKTVSTVGQIQPNNGKQQVVVTRNQRVEDQDNAVYLHDDTDISETTEISETPMLLNQGKDFLDDSVYVDDDTQSSETPMVKIQGEENNNKSLYLPDDAQVPEISTPTQSTISMLESMREELSCVICTEELMEPKDLNCSHSFCKSCLEKWSKSSGNQRSVRCPVCQQHTPLSNKGINGLKTNIIIRNLAKQFRLARMQASPLLCKSKSSSKSQTSSKILANKLKDKRQELSTNLVELRRRRNDWSQCVKRTMQEVDCYSSNLVESIKTNTLRKRQEVQYRNQSQVKIFDNYEKEITHMIKDISQEHSAVSNGAIEIPSSSRAIARSHDRARGVELCDKVPPVLRCRNMRFVPSGVHLREDTVGKIIVDESETD